MTTATHEHDPEDFYVETGEVKLVFFYEALEEIIEAFDKESLFEYREHSKITMHRNGKETVIISGFEHSSGLKYIALTNIIKDDGEKLNFVVECDDPDDALRRYRYWTNLVVQNKGKLLPEATFEFYEVPTPFFNKRHETFDFQINKFLHQNKNSNLLGR